MGLENSVNNNQENSVNNQERPNGEDNKGIINRLDRAAMAVNDGIFYLWNKIGFET